MGFTKEHLARYNNASVPDLVGSEPRLLFVGINPGLWTAATQTHFCHPSNRFYPALLRAGLIDWSIETTSGMTDSQRSDFTSRGMGITNLVNRATTRASELSPAELRDGGESLTQLVEEKRPTVVAVAGITAYRTAFSDQKAELGRQPQSLAGCALWAVPNPSGLNAHETIDSLAAWYRDAADEAGLH